MAKQDNWLKVTLRIPPELHARLVAATGPNSLNAELLTRLEHSLEIDEQRARLRTSLLGADSAPPPSPDSIDDGEASETSDEPGTLIVATGDKSARTAKAEQYDIPEGMSVQEVIALMGEIQARASEMARKQLADELTRRGGGYRDLGELDVEGSLLSERSSAPNVPPTKGGKGRGKGKA